MCLDDGCDDLLCCLCIPLAALCCCKCCKDMVSSDRDRNQVPTTVYYQQPGGQVPVAGVYGPQGYGPPPQQPHYYPGGQQAYYPPPNQQPGYPPPNQQSGYPPPNQQSGYPPYDQGGYYPPQPGYGGGGAPPPYFNQQPNPYK